MSRELKRRGFNEQEDGTMVRKDGDLTVKVDPCSGEVSVKAETESTVNQEAKREATGFNDVGPNERSLRDRVKDQLKQDLDKKFDQEQSRLQGKATEQLEKHLQDIQPEISEVVNEHDLVVCSVLSGNRNFEGRINQDVRMNYLASPPLVVAYAPKRRPPSGTVSAPVNCPWTCAVAGELDASTEKMSAATTLFFKIDLLVTR